MPSTCWRAILLARLQEAASPGDTTESEGAAAAAAAWCADVVDDGGDADDDDQEGEREMRKLMPGGLPAAGAAAAAADARTLNGRTLNVRRHTPHRHHPLDTGAALRGRKNRATAIAVSPSFPSSVVFAPQTKQTRLKQTRDIWTANQNQHQLRARTHCCSGVLGVLLLPPALLHGTLPILLPTDRRRGLAGAGAGTCVLGASGSGVVRAVLPSPPPPPPPPHQEPPPRLLPSLGHPAASRTACRLSRQIPPCMCPRRTIWFPPPLGTCCRPSSGQSCICRLLSKREQQLLLLLLLLLPVPVPGWGLGLVGVLAALVSSART